METRDHWSLVHCGDKGGIQLRIETFYEVSTTCACTITKGQQYATDSDKECTKLKQRSIDTFTKSYTQYNNCSCSDLHVYVSLPHGALPQPFPLSPILHKCTPATARHTWVTSGGKDLLCIDPLNDVLLVITSEGSIKS